MSDTPDINAAPYPANFTPPPGMPVPTAEDFAAEKTGTGANIQAPSAGIPWWVWAVGGAVVVGGVGMYASYRVAKKAAPLLLAYKAPELVPHYQAMQQATDSSARDVAMQNMVAALAKQVAPTPAVYSALQTKAR